MHIEHNYAKRKSQKEPKKQVFDHFIEFDWFDWSDIAYSDRGN